MIMLVFAQHLIISCLSLCQHLPTIWDAPFCCVNSM